MPTSSALAHAHLPKSLPALKEMTHRFMRQTARFEKSSAANEERAEGLIDAALVIGAAAGVSYLNGKQMQTKGTVYQFGGHDADLLGGAVVTLTAVLFPKALGKYTEKFGKVGVGLLAASATRASFAKGQTATLNAPAASGATAGVISASHYQGAMTGTAPASQYAQR
jgi:hypothetical protein